MTPRVIYGDNGALEIKEEYSRNLRLIQAEVQE